MMKQGEFNLLTAKRRTLNGYYLVDEEDTEVLLPNKYVPSGMKPDDEISVFIYKDSEDRLIATTIKPTIQLNEFAVLEVVDVNSVGAFLDWGLEKDLLVPYSEQSSKMQIGVSYPVFLYLDEQTQRLVASGRINRFLDNDEITVNNNDEVEPNSSQLLRRANWRDTYMSHCDSRKRRRSPFKFGNGNNGEN